MAVARNLAVVILTTWLLLIFLSTPAEGLMHNLKIRDDRRLKFFIGTVTTSLRIVEGVRNH